MPINAASEQQPAHFGRKQKQHIIIATNNMTYFRHSKNRRDIEVNILVNTFIFSLYKT